VCGKTKVGSDTVVKTEPSKNLTSAQMVFRQKLHGVCNLNYKWQKITSTSIQCADKDDTQCDCYSLLTTVCTVHSTYE